MRLFRIRQTLQRLVLATRHRCQRTIELAKAAARREIGNALPIHPDRATSALFARRIPGIGERRRRDRTQAGLTQTSGQQIIAIPMNRDVDAADRYGRLIHFRIGVRRLCAIAHGGFCAAHIGRCVVAAGRQQQGQRQSQQRRARDVQGRFDFHGASLSIAHDTRIVPWYTRPAAPQMLSFAASQHSSDLLE